MGKPPSSETPPLRKAWQHYLEFAGKSAAAFRALGQGGAIPAAAERLDQENSAGHPTAENMTAATSSARAALWAVVTSR